MWDLIERCWCQDPDSRLCARDILDSLRERKGARELYEIVDYERSSSSLLFHEANSNPRSSPDEDDDGEFEDTLGDDSSMDDIINLYTPDLSIVTNSLDHLNQDLNPPSSSSSPDSLIGRRGETYDSPPTEYSSPLSPSVLEWYVDSPPIRSRSPLGQGSPFVSSEYSNSNIDLLDPRSPHLRPPPVGGGLLSSLRDSWQTDHQTRKLRSRSRSALPMFTTPTRSLEFQHGRYRSMGNLSGSSWTGSTSLNNTSRLPLHSTTLPHTNITVLRSFVPPKPVVVIPYKIVIRVDPGDGEDTWDIAKTYGDLVKLDQTLRRILGEKVGESGLGSVPKEKLWSDNAPAKVDHRTVGSSLP